MRSYGSRRRSPQPWPRIAALVIVWVERAAGSSAVLLDVDAVSARAVLSAISGAMISFTALVFSVTMLVLQQASSMLSPRVTRTFLRDRFNQAVLGLFVATFVFALLTLASVRDSDVPQLGVMVALALVLVAVLAFVSYIDHMAHAIRPTSVIEAIARETSAVIESIYADGAGDEPGSSAPLTDREEARDRSDLVRPNGLHPVHR